MESLDKKLDKNLDERVIPGITAKQLIMYFGGIISIVTTVMWSAFSLKSDIRELSSLAAQNKMAIEQMRLENVKRDQDIQLLKIDLATIKIKIEIERNLK